MLLFIAVISFPVAKEVVVLRRSKATESSEREHHWKSFSP